jgi:hypothetical protein
VTKADGITNVNDAPVKSSGTDSLEASHFRSWYRQGKVIQSSSDSVTEFMDNLSKKNSGQDERQMANRDC